MKPFSQLANMDFTSVWTLRTQTNELYMSMWNEVVANLNISWVDTPLCMLAQFYYQLGTRKHTLSWSSCFPCLSVCLLVCLCIYTCHVCKNYILCIHLLPCDFILVDLMAALNTGIATMSTTAQLSIWDTEAQRQHRCDDVRLTESRNARSE